MKTVELFSGIGGFRVAADARRIETVWANDICAKACSVYRRRFGAHVLHEGNIAQFAHAIPPHELQRHMETAKKEFAKTNGERMKKGRVPLPDSELDALQNIAHVRPLYLGVLDAAENWLAEVCRETARAPSDAEWKAILASPLEGAIGVSLALQWRYNFGRLFDVEAVEECADE